VSGRLIKGGTIERTKGLRVHLWAADAKPFIGEAGVSTVLLKVSCGRPVKRAIRPVSHHISVVLEKIQSKRRWIQEERIEERTET